MSENHVLADSSGQKFFLKKYRFDNATRLIEIHAAKELFAHGGIPVIMPIPLLDGQTFFDLDGAHYALFPFVEGRQYERGLIFKKRLLEECPDMITVPSMPNDHLLHGDFLDLNVFFDEHDEVSRVFDFEKTGYGPRTFEIFRCMMYSLVHKPFPDSDMDRLEYFYENFAELEKKLIG